MPKQLDPLVTVEELAEACHVVGKTIRQWVKAGKLPEPTKIGRRLLWQRSRVEKLLQTPTVGNTKDSQGLK
jgi:excisionase family DNA binding protein